jgi:hypothetical protein
VSDASSDAPAPDDERTAGTSFEERAREPAPGFFAEFRDYLITHKKWWLVPIVLVLLLAAALVFLGSSPLAPFIYPL